jgi:hypothetical protein
MTMSWHHIRAFLFNRQEDAPVIKTQWGPVTEAARRQAAANIKADPELRKKVEALLARECGGLAQGLVEARRRYPEVYEDNGR